MPRPKNIEKDEDYLKKQKQQSRTQEAALTNSFLDILITDFHFEMKYSRTKGATKTVKMIVPSQLIDGETIYSKEDIMNMSHEICQTEKLDTTATVKQQKRNDEAKFANGVLALLKRRGYTFCEKKTRPCHKTTRLVRVSSLTFGSKTYSAKELITKGTEFGFAVASIMKNKEEIISRTNLKQSKESYSDIKRQLEKEKTTVQRQSDTIEDLNESDKDIMIKKVEIKKEKNELYTKNGTLVCEQFNEISPNDIKQWAVNPLLYSPIQQENIDNNTVELHQNLEIELNDSTETEDNPPNFTTYTRTESNPTAFANGHPSTDGAQIGFINR
ncbi:hypothetical protein EHI8A_123850 [Entamoeba histolytica HM-1:IMSS-B]|uniref:Uncharacterized protein n=6 Tax=Entamoeba histolytica TaxID=5759 RepID=C4M8G5_ENTH1|nr:hypothetical protein EHI_062970 [Entamoeba histolytica HM-1:IMSS]EMD45159.1 Hypothetical protein EHI5A_048170 [Entamoeba histolytica KU27]EMH72323.1 hypothetical protein EHI8A_123850 [Entamoeba histolytica HM-1:IMSS-B]EMS17033.1 hypothetical protein KM1_187880 [Entamoeba histolytica HM-3:IMSS]ENY61484.1 hypothetical protein EHI7A_115320 [Entamoeba histolytica HM-1:IMSS-A]GAT97891.1 hypothetical protein CL6EHI_062970 [Entamoeba histolytica]|eukprot:XP_650232.1 hypothetical protein EHI_062970 [Entamoeba histolytica HM-1:IMSS]